MKPLPLSRISLPVVGCLWLAACTGLGRENVIFTTSSSLGIVDVDTLPTRFALGYDRFEGSLGPVTPSGEIMPLLSGITTSTNPFEAFFAFGISTTFATGAAAIISTRFAGTDAVPDDHSAELNRLLDELADGGAREECGAVTVAKDETLRRYFFGTDTSLGLAISFAAGNPALPESLNLGWKRKELAIVPVLETGANGANGATTTYQLPSLLATSRASIGGGGTSIAQFYATGMAANYLTAHPELREMVLDRTGARLADRLSTIEARGTMAREDLERLVAQIPADKLEEALRLAQAKGFEASPQSTSDDHRRQALLDATIVFDDEDEVERLAALVRDLRPLALH